MTQAGQPFPHLGTRGRLGIGLAGLLAALLLGLVGVFAPGVVMHGWLIGFASTASIAIGCVAWLAIHGLTGGRWGEVGRPTLLGGAAGLPIAVLLVLPLILADHFVYPWAADPNAAGPGVAAHYLNTWFYALRSLALLVGLMVAGFLARRKPLGVLAAGLTLVFYGVLMSLTSFDWLLSLDPRYTSSAIGMQITTAQLAAGMCWVILGTAAPPDDKVWGDYGSLLLATVLGEAYLILMTFVVHWYGDLPAQAAWYLRRTEHGWIAVEIVGTLVGAVGPLLALLFARVRHAAGPLRIVALAVLVGIVLEMIWLVAPNLPGGAGWAAASAGVVATIAGAALMVAVAGSTSARRTREMADVA